MPACTGLESSFRPIRPPSFQHAKGSPMSLWSSNSKARDALAQANAISKSQAVIEFNMNGTIVVANQNFLDAMGYTLPEIAGKHHSMFMPGDTRNNPEYRAFWA